MSLRTILYVLPVLALFAACGFDDDQPTPSGCAEQNPTLEEFAASDTVTYDELGNSGLLYYIVDSGGVERPTISSRVTANYTGFFTNGNIFDGTTAASGPATFPLANVIEGWQLGVPLIGEGGKIRLLLPSNLAYGTNGNCDRFGRCSICPDTDLVFDIELVSFTG